jgi:hypothetical protein
MSKKKFPERKHDSLGWDGSLLWKDKTGKVQFILTPKKQQLWVDYSNTSLGAVYRDINTNEVVENYS